MIRRPFAPRSRMRRQTLSVPATADGVRQAAEAVSVWIRSHRLADELRIRALTTLDEVLSNVVRHGLRGRTGMMQVTIATEDGILEVEIADRADEFNPLLQPAPATDAPIDDRRPGGLGLVLVRALADDVCYERREDQNRVKLRFEPRAGMPAGPAPKE
jgi:serine/threonine-protein kinase RsbW